jgi:hypothetical protein
MSDADLAQLAADIEKAVKASPYIFEDDIAYLDSEWQAIADRLAEMGWNR